jgi:uncharacterized protein YdbL (DUF1318 family)
MTVCLRILVVAAMMMGGLTAWSSQAIAQSLDAARASGMIGERYDGYAVARGTATPAMRNLVASVNSQRRKIYAQRAREQKISADKVGKLYAVKIVAKAPKGTWIQSQSGAWKRK